jgi:tetratricopeptide (TPR) repeat protein
LSGQWELPSDRYYEAENNLGEALLVRNQVEEAARHVDRSIEINPTYAASHWNKALILARQAKSNEAYEIVDQGRRSGRSILPV